MNKLLTLIAASTLALGMGTALGASSDNAATSTAQDTKQKNTSFMFAVSAKSGAVTKNANGTYTLTMKKSDLNKVIMFSDRPERIVKDITAKFLASDWSKGGGRSFAKDNPNAVLSGANLTPVIVKVESIKMDAQSIRYTYNIDTSGSMPVGAVTSPVLVVDSFWWTFMGCTQYVDGGVACNVICCHIDKSRCATWSCNIT